MFRGTYSGDLLFLQRETNSKENMIIKKIMNMEIATNFEACGLHINP